MSLMKIILLPVLLFSFNSAAITIKACDNIECVNYFKSFKKAAQRGHSKAMYMLAKFYQNGYGTDINLDKSLTYYRKAALRGIFEAKFKTGYLLLTNTNTYDYDEGVKWLTKAASSGHQNAAYVLGVTYFNENKLIKADKWLAVAYEKHQVDMPKWLKHINKNKQYDETKLPLLASALANDPINIKGERESFDQNIERITISSPSLQSMFDGMLVGFRTKLTSTGTRLPIRCVNNIACQEKSLNEMKDSIWVSH